MQAGEAGQVTNPGGHPVFFFIVGGLPRVPRVKLIQKVSTIYLEVGVFAVCRHPRGLLLRHPKAAAVVRGEGVVTVTSR